MSTTPISVQVNLSFLMQIAKEATEDTDFQYGIEPFLCSFTDKLIGGIYGQEVIIIHDIVKDEDKDGTEGDVQK